MYSNNSIFISSQKFPNQPGCFDSQNIFMGESNESPFNNSVILLTLNYEMVIDEMKIQTFHHSPQ